MADWLNDIFNEDTFKTIVNGLNTAGSIFNAASPLINAGSQVAAGINGTQNAAAYKAANQQAMDKLDAMFSPTGDYAQELRNQVERKDAAAGRRSQYGTRETQLMAQLAKEKAAVLTSPAYQRYMAGANTSPYAPIAGAVGSLTGGTQQGQQGQQRKAPNIPSGLSDAGQYLYQLFGPASEISAANIGGAGAALGGGGPAAQGVVDSLGSLFGGNPYLPGYGETATGIFGNGAGASSAGSSTIGDASGALGTGFTAAGDLASAGLGGAGAGLSGMGAGSLAGTVGGADTLGALAGGTGFLPGYGAAGGATGSGIFGGAAAGAGAGEAAGAAGAGAAGGGGAAGGAGLAGMAAPVATALPFLAALYGIGGGIFGYSDDYDPRTTQQKVQQGWDSMQSSYGPNSYWATGDKAAQNAATLRDLTGGAGDLNTYMNKQFGGNGNYTEDQWGQAYKNMLGYAGRLDSANVSGQDGNGNWMGGNFGN